MMVNIILISLAVAVVGLSLAVILLGREKRLVQERLLDLLDSMDSFDDSLLD